MDTLVVPGDGLQRAVTGWWFGYIMHSSIEPYKLRGVGREGGERWRVLEGGTESSLQGQRVRGVGGRWGGAESSPVLATWM